MLSMISIATRFRSCYFDRISFIKKDIYKDITIYIRYILLIGYRYRQEMISLIREFLTYGC